MYEKRESGYLLLELLAALAVIAVVGGSTMVQTNAWLEVYYKQQVQCAARQLAEHLRFLQQETMYADRATIILDTSNIRGYYIVDGAYVVQNCTFASQGWPEVYFRERLPSIGFGTDGAPRSSGKYVLGHKKLLRYKYLVEVQPVTGRVLVYERQ